MNGNEGRHSSSENKSENDSENDSENKSENGIPKFIKRRKRNLLQTWNFQEGL